MKGGSSSPVSSGSMPLFAVIRSLFSLVAGLVGALLHPRVKSASYPSASEWLHSFTY